MYYIGGTVICKELLKINKKYKESIVMTLILNPPPPPPPPVIVKSGKKTQLFCFHISSMTGRKKMEEKLQTQTDENSVCLERVICTSTRLGIIWPSTHEKHDRCREKRINAIIIRMIIIESQW